MQAGAQQGGQDGTVMDAGGLPLAGLCVVDLGGIGPGPFCSLVLAALGASVIRFERPSRAGEGDLVDPFADGRATIHADLKTPEGKAAALSLVGKADMLIEGFRPGTTERLGLGPDDCAALNPRLIYGRMTGWGQSGPFAADAGHDINYIALSGVLHAIGTCEGGPVVPLNLLGDFAGGSFFLIIGLLAALAERERSGRGQVIDAAIVDGTAALSWFIQALRRHGAWRDAREANLLDGGAPWYGVYETADGGHVALGALEPQFYDRFAAVAGLDIDTLPSRDDPTQWPALRARIATLFRSRSRDEWARLFAGSDACVAPVLSLSEAPRHPHVMARGVFDAGGGDLPRLTPLFGRSPTRRGYGTGEHGDLGAWNLSDAEAALVSFGGARVSRRST